tara:strand:- start:648 stop:2075 length:1428 start_codon:yes stop_codon:yes gene_type:complete
MAVQNSIIEQRPLYNTLPVGQDVIFVISNEDAVANYEKVKFIVDIHISGTTPPDTTTTNDLVGTYKTTPNNAGVGMFDLRNVIENYVKADNMAADGSSYKATVTTPEERHPIHLIDKYSLNNNSARYMALVFAVEYLGADDGNNQDANTVRRQVGTEVNSDLFTLFNGYVKHTDKLIIGTPVNDDFGIDISDFDLSVPGDKFLTNAPLTQYANLEDYGTLAFLALDDKLDHIDLQYYDSAGSSLGTESITRDVGNGAYATWDAEINKHLLFFGCFPANLQNWSTTFQALVTAGTIQGGEICVIGRDSSNVGITDFYKIKLNCPEQKNYEPIRLCWLNQWGAWDYYTFTKKSSRTISTKGTTYTQLSGTWNESLYRLDTYRGGKKALRRNATERISMNTDFVREDDNVIFEELINSPEVYLLEGFQTDVIYAALNQYVTPVTLSTSSFARKTVANDKLIQYSFDIEKTKMLRTQSI